MFLTFLAWPYATTEGKRERERGRERERERAGRSPPTKDWSNLSLLQNTQEVFTPTVILLRLGWTLWTPAVRRALWPGRDSRSNSAPNDDDGRRPAGAI